MDFRADASASLQGIVISEVITHTWSKSVTISTCPSRSFRMLF